VAVWILSARFSLSPNASSSRTLAVGRKCLRTLRHGDPAVGIVAEVSQYDRRV